VRILAVAYACEPQEGSEPGTGWAWARMLAHIGDTWVITRANNREAIEEQLPNTPERERLHFVYVDLPPWARFWKRGQRGVRLYYLLWQAAAARNARSLHRTNAFDLVWHLTLANAWLGSLAPVVPAPFVYGPVGGGTGTPWRLLPALGMRGAGYELLRAAARTSGRYLNPVARLAWMRAHLILVQNPETREWLPRQYRTKAEVFPNPVIDRPVLRAPGRSGPPVALFAGRLLPWKGVALALMALASLPTWKLLVCGTGVDERRLRRHARRLGVERRVEFLGLLTRENLLRIMQEDADVLLFPSLHDEAGWVVVEALACGLPVACIDRGGPPILVGPAGLIASPAGGPERVAASLALLLSSHFPSSATIEQRAEEFTTDKRVDRLERLLSASALVQPSQGAAAVLFEDRSVTGDVN
jgi:glycosyltransferase involved in cell wall biosynthesis